MNLLKMFDCFHSNTGNIDIIWHCPYLVCKRHFHGSLGKFMDFDPIKCTRLNPDGEKWTEELQKNCELIKRSRGEVKNVQKP
jgi:hypothetical protein